MIMTLTMITNDDEMAMMMMMMKITIINRMKGNSGRIKLTAE